MTVLGTAQDFLSIVSTSVDFWPRFFTLSGPFGLCDSLRTAHVEDTYFCDILRMAYAP
jgi:hypothetical protein